MGDGLLRAGFVVLAVLVIGASVAGAATVSPPRSSLESVEPPSDCRDVRQPAVADADVTGEAELDYGDAVTLEYDLPRGRDAFTVVLRGVEEIEETDGFEVNYTEADTVELLWDGAEQDPSVTYLAESESSSDWANGIFRAPAHPDIDVNLTAADEGLVSPRLMYLGDDYYTKTEENGCETIRVVVPCGVVVDETPARVRDSVGEAAAALDVGGHPERMTLIAAEDVRRLFVAGTNYGRGDALVNAESELDEPSNVWVHEYVHSRQQWRGNDAANAAWLTEATAEYYAARLTYEQGRISAEDYREHIDVAVSEATLADPDTWSISTPYTKGALVFAGLDQRLRAANESASGETFLRAVNAEATDGDGNLTHAQVREIAVRQGNDSVGTWLDRYVTTSRTPVVKPTSPSSGFDDARTSPGLLEQIEQDIANILNNGAWILSPSGGCGRGGAFW